MKTNFRRFAALALMLMMLCSVGVLAQKKKKPRKKVPIPRSRAEVVTMSGGSTHDVERSRTNNGQGTLVTTGDAPPDQSYKSPLDSLGRGDSSPAVSRATTKERSRRTSVGSNLIRPVTPTTRPSLRIGKPTTYHAFYWEIKCSVDPKACENRLSDLAVAQRTIGEMKRQLAAGRKVTLDDGTAIGPDNIVLKNTYKGTWRHTLISASGEKRDLGSGEDDQESFTAIDETHYWGPSEYYCRDNIFTKSGPTTFTHHCELHRDDGRVEILDDTAEFKEGALYWRREIKDQYGDLNVWDTSLQFDYAAILLVWK